MIHYPPGFVPNQDLRQAKSYVRALHASPNAPAVDIYINGTLFARNLSYRSFTEYRGLDSGNYNIQVFPADQSTNPVFTKSIFLPAGAILTVAATGMVPNIDVVIVPEQYQPKVPGKSSVRFVHLSPDTPSIDVTQPTGDALFRNVAFKQISSYIPLGAGNYTLQLRPAGTKKVILTVPNVRISANRYYTIYFVGLSSGNPPLQLLLPLDGISYIKL